MTDHEDDWTTVGLVSIRRRDDGRCDLRIDRSYATLDELWRLDGIDLDELRRDIQRAFAMIDQEP